MCRVKNLMLDSEVILCRIEIVWKTNSLKRKHSRANKRAQKQLTLYLLLEATLHKVHASKKKVNICKAALHIFALFSSERLYEVLIKTMLFVTT